MVRYEVQLTLCRIVTVEVEATSPAEAREAASDRARWVRSEGTRRPLRLLCASAPERID